MKRLLLAIIATVLILPAFAKHAKPDSGSVIRYMGDKKAYSLPARIVHDVLADKTMSADAFVEAYYEPLRKRMPKYVRRDSIGVDDSGKYTMWCYTFTPRKYKKTIYLQAGVHGRNEFESYFAAAFVMQLIANAGKSRDPHLKYLRKNVRFIVVPVVNVYDLAERSHPPFNASNININRDWFDARTQEVRIIKALLSRYGEGEIDFAFDLHTDPEGIPGWGAYLLPWADDLPADITEKLLAINNYLYDLHIPGKVLYNGQNLLKAYMGPNSGYPSSSREWRAHWQEDFKRGTATKTCTNGICKDYGIPASTLEHGARKFGPEGSVTEMTRAIELFLNHIIAQSE